ncbi:MAG: methyltransferase [Thermodesulfobacteriota bacterium]
MDPTTLPEKQFALYREILKRYKVSFSPLTVRDHHLEILQVDDLEPLLAGKDPFKDVESFPFWVKLWEASLALADLMASLPPKPGQTLLELGAGLGAPGLAAAAAGYEVTLSDYEQYILNFQKVNAAASSVEGRVRHVLLDWLAPPKELPQFDTIIGAEILFRETFFEPLITIFRQYLKPGGVIYLAHDVRRKSLPTFLVQAEKHFVVAVSKRTLRTEDKELTIIINRLTPRT